MLKRVTWFVAGALTGAGGTVYAKRRLRTVARRYRPSGVARRVNAAVHEGRTEMRRREAELRGELGDGQRAARTPPIA